MKMFGERKNHYQQQQQQQFEECAKNTTRNKIITSLHINAIKFKFTVSLAGVGLYYRHYNLIS